MNIHEKLQKIQHNLKAPKGQFNSFGKYKYRNCEDILEASKPLLEEYKCTLILSDKIENIEDRFYIKATATLTDCEDTTQSISVTAYAREEESKKGMDGSQVTGASSSYSRKYALNGLLAIDDTKDSDTTNKGEDKPSNNPSNDNREKLIKELVGIARKKGYNEKAICKKANISDIKLIKNEQITSFKAGFEKLPDKEG